MEINVYNSSKLAFHKDKVEALAKNQVTSPVYVRVKPTNKCNHRCFYCSYQPDNECPTSEIINFTDEIPKEKMMEILSNFRDMGVKAITYSGGGEPLIYPHILETLEKTLEYGIDLSIITNGQMLKGEIAEVLANAKWVRVSADYCNAETFSKIRRISEDLFYEMANNLRNFAKIKNPDCEFGINFVVHEKNADKVYESAKFFKELGVNHIKITPCYFPSFLEYHKDIKESVEEQIKRARQELQDDNFTVYDTYENDFNLTGMAERKYSKCYVMQTIPVIGADCVVYFCHDKTYTKNGAFGSIKDKSFKDLWFNEETARILETFDPQIGCRHHCTGDGRNLCAIQMLQDLENIDSYKPQSDKHKNFV